MVDGTFDNLTVNTMINSHASGSSPVANSNAGMILDCYTPNHRDGLGIQSGGIWLKYDTSFNIYNDNGTSLLEAVHLDNLGDMTITGALSSTVSSSAPVAGSSAGMKLDFWPASHSDGLGMQYGIWLKYGTQFDIYRDSGTAITNPLHLDNSGNMTIAANAIFKSTITHLTKEQIVSRIWHYTGTVWDPSGLLEPASKITMTSIEENPRTLNLFEIIEDDEESEVEPLLATDVGLVVQKDIAAGGFINSNQGELWLGSGRNSHYDPPKIVLSHDASGYGGQTTLYLTTFSNISGGFTGYGDGNLDLANLNSHGKIYFDAQQDQIKFSPNGYDTVFWTYKPSDGKCFGIWNDFAEHWVFFVDSSGSVHYHGSLLADAYDSLDDLTLVKNLRTKIVKQENPATKQEFERVVIDPESLTFLRDENGFGEYAKDIGFVFGCIKALVNRVEALEKLQKEQLD